MIVDLLNMIFVVRVLDIEMQILILILNVYKFKLAAKNVKKWWLEKKWEIIVAKIALTKFKISYKECRYKLNFNKNIIKLENNDLKS